VGALGELFILVGDLVDCGVVRKLMGVTNELQMGCDK